MKHGKVHALDAPADDPRMDHIRRDVKLEGPLTPEQRARLLEIAERCPVHRTMLAGAGIETALAP